MSNSAISAEIFETLASLMADQQFRSSLAQVRARALQTELLPDRQLHTRFTFDPKQVWQYCDYIFSEGSLLLREGHEQRETIQGWIKEAAQAFEFLARFANDDDRELFLLNAAICYDISGYRANGQCITQLVVDTYHTNLNPDAEDSWDRRTTKNFRLVLADFLLRRIVRLQWRARLATDYIQGSQEQISLQLAEQQIALDDVFGFTAHAFFAKTFTEFVQYCVEGQGELIEAAESSLQKSHLYFQKASEVRMGTITSELRTALKLFEERSIWSNVARYVDNAQNNAQWRLYLRNLAYEKSIVELWPSQMKAVQSGLLSTNQSFVVQMPTSAGKTFVAELAILSALIQPERGRCLYIAPYRALVYEVQNKLSETIGEIGYKVSNLMGGFEFDALQNFLLTDSDVIVATPEKVELFLRTHPDYFNRLSVVVVDEGHIIDEGVPSAQELASEGKTLNDYLERQGTLGRGILLEMLITRLKQKLPDARFIFMSAVMSKVNAHDFVEWLSENQQESLQIDPSLRPSRQVMATFKWISQQNGELEYVKGVPRLPNGRPPFVPYFLAREQYDTGQLTPTGRPGRRTWPDIGNKAQSTAMVAARCARSGPVLVFCAQKSHIESVVTNLMTSLQYLEASGRLPHDRLRRVEDSDLESFYLATEWLGTDHYLTRAILSGVGVHHGSLPDVVRRAVENDFKSGNLRILVSTNTLGQGVNLPIKTVVIYSLQRVFSEDNGASFRSVSIKKRDFWNICGRAGRAGKETEGQIIFMNMSPTDRNLLQEYLDEENIERVDSALYKLLMSLVENRISSTQLITYLDSHVLALIAEEVVDTTDEAAVTNFLGKSLVGVQAVRAQTELQPLTHVVRNTAQSIFEAIEDEKTLRVFSSTGLSVASCKVIAQAVDRFLEELQKEKWETPLFENDIQLLNAAFEACRNLIEMRRVNEDGDPTDEYELVKSWIEGRTVNEIRDNWWNGTSEEFNFFLADRVIYRLPWGFNGFLRILAYKMDVDFEDLTISWQNTASMMKYGVNNAIACWVISLGISSRRLAISLANVYGAGTTFGDFVKWIVNLPTEFIFQHLEGYDFEKEELLHRINEVALGEDFTDFILSNVPHRSIVTGVEYAGRQEAAAQVAVYDLLDLEAEDNRYDPYAIRVLFQGQHLGYLQRDIARVVFKELKYGHEFQTRVISLLIGNDGDDRVIEIEVETQRIK